MSIEICDLCVSYAGTPVLEQVKLSIEPRKTLSILGPNGAGKTTLLNAIAGLLAPVSGSIIYDGKIHKRMTPHQMALLIGYVPQVIIPAFDYSVLDYVVTGCAPRIGAFSRPGQEHYEIALQAIGEMGIAHLTEKSYRRISGGERQQVSIARVIAQRPAYILMDEPTSHLDYGNQILVLKTIQRLAREGFGIVFTTHNPDHVLLLGGRVAVIDRKGSLRCGSCNEMMNEEFLSELYGIDLRLIRPDHTGRNICFAPDLR